ncbi:MAG: tetratricopeptide repeat protein [Chloroflexi bacterium]|nr:tetratricopeptide repeat protein [Chloroflexota bacterium]
MPALKVYLFGSPVTIRDDVPLSITSQKAQALFYYLICNRQAHSREKLATLFWGETSERQAKGSLRNTLYELRRDLTPGNEPAEEYILAESNTLCFNPEADCWLDVEQFEKLLDQKAESERARMDNWSKAVELYRGDFLEGFIVRDSFEFEDWAFFERERLQRRHLEALTELSNYCGRQGEYERAIAYAIKILGRDSLQENIHRQLMRLYYAAGNRSAALRQYEICQEVTERELGVPPLAETTTLYEQILRQELVEPPAREMEAPRREPGVELQWPLRPSPLRPWPKPEYLSSSLVGRDKEYAQLTRHLEAASQGKGQLVIVDGEVGVGKTRLVQELLDRAEPDFHLLIGRCYESEMALPYQPVVEALRGLLPTVNMNRLQISSLWLREVSKLVPELGEALPDLPNSVPLNTDTERSRLFEGVAQFLVALSRQRPLTLFIDDLHWADQATLTLLQYLARHVTRERILLIGAYRAEDLNDLLTNTMRSLNQDGLLSRITLRRLTLEEVITLIREMAGMESGGERFSRRLYQETEGNPFFIFEVIRSLFEQGILYRDEHGWSTDLKDFATNYAQVPIPPSVRDVIQVRLNRLDETSRQVLETAAVFRQQFYFDTIKRTCDKSEDEILDAFDRLLRAQLIKEVEVGMEGSSYDFNHDKIREVAYQQMSGARRQQVHRRVGEALEIEYRHRLDEGVSQLAYHFVAGGDREKALRYSIKAGDRARELYANEEAIVYYQRAIELAESEEELATIYEGLGDVYALVGKHQKAIESYKSVLDSAGEGLDKRRVAEIHRKIGRVYERNGGRDLALEHFRTGRRILESDGPSLEMVRLDSGMAFLNIRQGQYEEAIRLCQRSLDMLETLPDNVASRKERARIYNNLGSIYLNWNDYPRATEHFEKSLAIRIENEDTHGIAVLYNNLGVVYERQGHYDQAFEYHRQSFELEKEIGDIYGLAISHTNLGLILSHREDHSQAIDHLEEAVSICGNIKCEWLLPEAYRIMAEIRLALGEVTEALEFGQASLEMALKTGDTVFEGVAHRVLGKVKALGQQQWEEGESHFSKSIDILKALGNEHELGKSYYEFGLVLRDRGEVARAQQCLSQAIEIFERTGAPERLERAKTAYHQL